MGNIEIKKLDNSEIEIIAEISAEDFDSFRDTTVVKLGASIEVSGFRKGHVPANVLEQKIGEASLLHAMAERAITAEYPKIVEAHKLTVIGAPEITITKMAKGNPLQFKITTAVVPEINLPDYKSIAKRVMAEKSNVSIDEKDMENTILEIRTNWATQMQAMKKKVSGDDKKETSQEGSPVLPEFNDEFVKQLGDFKTVSEFRKKLKENILKEKTKKEKEKKRLSIIDDIIKETKISVPKVLIESELDKMMAQFKDNVAVMGQKPDDYFLQIKKTENEVKAGWRKDAVKRVETQLILHKVGEVEEIKIPEAELKTEVEKVVKQYPGAGEDRARSYVENLLLNEKTFEFLEGQV